MLALTLCTPASATDVRWDDFLSAVAQVESGNRAVAIGDAGLARGLFQIHVGAWDDVNRRRQGTGRPQLSWCSAAPLTPDIARSYASEYLQILHGQLAPALGRPPTAEELYAAYNLGFTGFKRRWFLIERCPQTTRRAAARLREILSH